MDYFCMEMDDAMTTICTFLKTNGFALYNKFNEACNLDFVSCKKRDTLILSVTLQIEASS